MSARGARSRKFQQKDIEKNEKKIAVKGKAVEASSTDDKFAKWRSTPVSRSTGNTQISRSVTALSRATSHNSSTNNSYGRLQLEALRSSGSIELRAPKISHPSCWAEPVSSCPPANQKSWVGFRVWEGGKEDMRPYGGFDFDEDMQDGTVLIYFKEEQADEDCPIPSIRAELKTLENSGSTWISNALLYGRIDNDENEWSLPSSPQSLFPPQPFVHGNLHGGRRRMMAPVSPGGQSPLPFNIDQTYGTISSRTTFQVQSYSDNDRSEHSNSPRPFQRSCDRSPTHEIWFTAPASIRTPQEQRLHHVAVRNYLAMLHNKPIVGANLFDMLNTLQPEIQVMYDLEGNSQSNITPREYSVQMLTNYLSRYGVDDIRNDIKNALGLLAWSEQEGVQWCQGYLESFVHLAGLMSARMEALPDFRRLSTVTRRNLGIAGKTLQLRVMEAEEKLATFDFSDLWEDTSRLTNSPVYQSYQSFRQFLTNHYSSTYGKWPPTSTSSWLDRKIVLELQEELGSLYDYLVDRNVIWNPCEERASRKWEMANRKVGDFKADLPELGMTDMLISFDAKHGYAHIPHPYPLLPKDVPKAAKEAKKSFFGSLKKDKNKDTTKDAKTHLQLSIVFGDATNIEKLGVNYTGSALIEKFEKFELTTHPKHATPREARLGRWVLLYGILQVLSTLSVEIQGLKHTDNVSYFLCADLKRCPEWVINGQVEFLEASQQRSWCWQRAWDPTSIQTAPAELSVSTGNETAQDEYLNKFIERYRNPPPFLTTPTPSLDGTTLTQNNIQHISEQLNTALSVSNPYGVKDQFPQEPRNAVAWKMQN